MTSLGRRHPVGFAATLIGDTSLNQRRFSGAEDLLDSGAEILDETGRARLSGEALLLAVQLSRATHAFEALIVLCRIGRGIPAAALARTLLEDALDAYWVASKPDEAAGRAARHDRLISLADRDIEERFGRPTEPLTEAETDEFEALKREYQNFRLSWTKEPERARINLIKARWGKETARQLDYVYDAIQRRNNVLVHGSPTAYLLAMSHDADTGRRQINRIGPDQWWRESLAHGVLGYYLTCRVVAEEFGIDKTDAANRFELVTCYLKRLPAEALDGVQAAAPCPCGSGRRAGDCHLT